MTDATVYAVASGKGGVGKTTTAVNLGAGFADAGRRVVIVDADLGMGNLGDLVEATPAGPTLHEVLAGEATLDDALSHVQPGLDVVLGSEELELFGRADPRGFRQILGQLRDRYDIVILDSGAGLSHDTALPLGLADEVVLVSTVEKAAVKNAKKTLDLARTLEATVAGIVLTRVGGGKEEVDPPEIAARLELSLLGSVPEDSTVPRSAREGEPLLTFDRDSPAAQAYLEIAYDMMGENLPMGIGSEDAGDVEAQTDVPTTGAGEPLGEPNADELGSETAEEAIEEGRAGAPPGEGDAASGGSDAEGAPEPRDADAESAPEETGDEGADTPAGGTAPDESAGEEGKAETPEEPSEAAESEPELDIEEAEPDDEEESRSFLSKITGGLLG